MKYLKYHDLQGIHWISLLSDDGEVVCTMSYFEFVGLGDWV
jgi:hypothetical protein